MVTAARVITAAQRESLPPDVVNALTLRPPWGWAVMWAHKCVENRTWAPRTLVDFIPCSGAQGLWSILVDEWI